MKKIPTLFLRDEQNRARVTRTVNPECQWVLDGEGVPTRKWDGTACMFRGGKMFKRLTVKPGRPKPDDFESCGVDDVTGKEVGWVPVGDGPEDKYHREAAPAHGGLNDGTYELIGPKINGGREGWGARCLVRHDRTRLECSARDFVGLVAWLAEHPFEGIVWHHADGRMAKLKRKDVGLKWPCSRG